MQVPCRCRCMPVPRSSISGFAMKKTLAHLLSKYVSVECATLPTAFTILALPGCCVPRAIPPLTHDVLIFLISVAQSENLFSDFGLCTNSGQNEGFTKGKGLAIMLPRNPQELGASGASSNAGIADTNGVGGGGGAAAAAAAARAAGAAAWEARLAGIADTNGVVVGGGGAAAAASAAGAAAWEARLPAAALAG
eukprot:1137680-Pelagomonas_calceolata.AAC.1